MLNYHTNLVESRHFDFAPDLPDFRGGAFPRVVRFLVDTSICTIVPRDSKFLPHQ